LAGCAASDPSPGGRGGKGNATGTGTGAGGSDSTGSGGSGGTTGGGNTGGSIGPINPGNPDATTDGRISEDAQCAGEPVRGEKKQTDLYIMMDSSGSMNEVDPGQTLSRWENLAQAIPIFVNDPANANMKIGLDFFPEGGNQASCNVADYTMINVPVDFIPGMNNAHATALVNAVNGRMRVGGTPTTPALTGALQQAKAWQIAHPERSINVLFLTDGEPTGCQGNNINAAAAVAQQYANGTPPIKTYVLGVGPSTGPLDAIAAGGGTRMAYMVTNGGAAALAQALADIRKSTLSCDYNIPKLEGGMADPTKINVSTRIGPPPGMFSDILNVGDAAGCSDPAKNPSGNGWYYDNPAAPSKITLCPSSCSPLQMTDGSEINVIIGCKVRVIPPPN
jgi:hypothetical protein